MKIGTSSKYQEITSSEGTLIIFSDLSAEQVIKVFEFTQDNPNIVPVWTFLMAVDIFSSEYKKTLMFSSYYTAEV